MRVRSSAASAWDEVGAGGDEGRFRSGRAPAGCRPRAPLRRVARVCSSRSLARFTASRALSRSASLAEPVRRALRQAIGLLAGLHQLALGIGDAVLGGPAFLGLARYLGIVAIALADRRLGERRD